MKSIRSIFSLGFAGVISIGLPAQAQTPPKDHSAEIAALYGPGMPPMGLRDADERVRAASRLIHSTNETEKAQGFEALEALTQNADIDVATDARMSLAVVTTDRTKSRAVLNDCTEANPDAINCLTWLGIYRRFGTGGPVDEPGSAAAFSRAAKLGSPDAQWYYGMALFRGLGVKADADLGYEWVEKSAKQDHVSALVSYGTMNALGQGTKIDLAQAYRANARAAALGNVHSLYVVGQSLMTGEGVEKNLDLADTAILMAAIADHPDASADVRKLLSQIPKEDSKIWLEDTLARSEKLMADLERVQISE